MQVTPRVHHGHAMTSFQTTVLCIRNAPLPLRNRRAYSAVFWSLLTAANREILNSRQWAERERERKKERKREKEREREREREIMALTYCNFHFVTFRNLFWCILYSLRTNYLEMSLHFKKIRECEPLEWWEI